MDMAVVGGIFAKVWLGLLMYYIYLKIKSKRGERTEEIPEKR